MTPKAPNRTRAGTKHLPTADSRLLVSTLAAEGIPQATIARAIPPAGIAVNTLKKHYADELETGRLLLLVSAHRRLLALINDPASGEAGTDAAMFIIERYGAQVDTPGSAFKGHNPRPGQTARTSPKHA